MLLEFYEGTLLKNFNDKKSKLLPGYYGATSLYLEYPIPVPGNKWKDDAESWYIRALVQIKLN